MGIRKKISGISADKQLHHYVLLIKALKAIATLTFDHYFVICISSYAIVHMLYVMGSVFLYVVKFIIEINTVIKLAHK